MGDRMLTRLRISGFKNLLDIDIRLGPFTCIAGKNAVGKSNLFDAIRFLHLLTQHSIMEAVKLLRETKGRSPEPRSLFTSFGRYMAPEIRFVADLLINRDVEDDFGDQALAAISTLRYTLAFRLSNDSGTERLELAEESLVPIAQEAARKDLGFPAKAPFKDSIIKGRRSQSLISTTEGDEGSPLIRVHQEGHGGRMVAAPKSSRTVIGGLASSDFPTILAVHREMESWRTLLLEPSAMRSAALYSDQRFIDNRGANLPAAIERLRRREDRKDQVYASLANKLSELIEDVRELRIKDDERTETFTLEVSGRDGVFHPAGSLSDGTLRFLVLSTLAIDPDTKGIICLEEPENGIHPERIPVMVRLLRDIAVDSNFPVDADNPLRQVIINTHSPVVVTNIHPNDLIYFEEEQIVTEERETGKVASPRVPAGTWRATPNRESHELSIGQLRSYLSTASEPNPPWLSSFDKGAAN